MSKTAVAAVQMRARPLDVDHNLAQAGWFLEEAADKGAKLVLLPELFNVGYYVGPELFELWEREDGRTVTWMRERAERHRVIVAGSIAERRHGRLLNTLFMVEPGGRLYRYAKRQPMKHELAAFDPGDDNCIVATSLGRIGLAVCADIIWGRSLLRQFAGNIDLLLSPQASFTTRTLGRLQWWWEQRRGGLVEPVVRAIGAPYVTAGMIGPMQPVTRLFDTYMLGGTRVVNAYGRTLASVPFDEQGLAMAEVTLSSTGGMPNSEAFRDPGLGRDLVDCLIRTLPNIRPMQDSRSESQPPEPVESHVSAR